MYTELRYIMSTLRKYKMHNAKYTTRKYCHAKGKIGTIIIINKSSSKLYAQIVIAFIR